MRAFAEFVMRGRMQATLGVAGSIAVPLLFWLGAAGGGLVLLRRGLSDALSILFWALLPALLWWYLGDPSILLIMAGTLVLAQVLRATTSWVWVLLSSVVLGMVFIALLSTVSRGLIESLVDAVRPMIPQLMKDLPADQLAAVQESLKPTLTGLIASSFQAASLLCLVLARYWQAALFNPGGFGQEFRAVRLPPALAIALLAGVLLAPALGVEAAALSPICMVPLLFAGVGLGHGLIALKRLSSFWVIGLYVAVLLAGNLICLLAVIDGLFDFRGRLARKNGAGPANGEG
ncbi:hypothetical protein [Pseudomonas alcaligenes]|uniref:DUF2232 domain-containing protein n=1 Tax=Aquipseudomonas alcaligenes TaxID=43263 RepID=A0A2V4KK09_AQUAC|nr:hypothetical protein [Pseudomonas alcaligenes]PYC21991.1 hypothetical protein DMO17_16200 [Pseudomonas alcaligenes]